MGSSCNRGATATGGMTGARRTTEGARAGGVFARAGATGLRCDVPEACATGDAVADDEGAPEALVAGVARGKPEGATATGAVGSAPVEGCAAAVTGSLTRSANNTKRRVNWVPHPART
ncbi:hypothetical protein D9M68_956000 [compost metagenome]